jgi:hypothetical protein
MHCSLQKVFFLHQRNTHHAPNLKMKLSYGTNRTSVPFPQDSMFTNHNLFDFAQSYLKRQLWFDPGNGIDAIVEDESELWFCCKLLETHFNANMDTEDWQSVQDSIADADHTRKYEHLIENIETSEEECQCESDDDGSNF